VRVQKSRAIAKLFFVYFFTTIMVIKDEYMMAARLSKRGKTHQIPLRLWQTVDDIACRR